MILLQLAILLLCIAGSAFFAGIETGAISIHRLRLRHSVRRGDMDAHTMEHFLEHPDRLLGTTLVGNNITIVTISVITASLASASGRAVQIVISVLTTLMILLLCEFLPKAWFRARPLERSARFAGLLRFFELLLRPLAWVVVGVTRLIVPGPQTSFGAPPPFVTREDLKILAHESEKDGALSSRERMMINRVFELSGKLARDIMIPRAQMVTVNHDMTVGQFYDKSRESGLTRLPVIDDMQDKVLGVVNVFYLLSEAGADRDGPIATFARDPLFIRDTMPVDDIFPRLRRFRQPMCLVKNRTGDTVGLITTEDILEEIVGKL